MTDSTEDKIKGKATELKGDVKAAVGKATDNPKLESEGNADKAAGKVQNKVGDVKKVFDK